MKIEEALLILTSTKTREMTVKDAVSILELVTKNPETIKKALKSAEEKGIIKREGKKIYVSREAWTRGEVRIRERSCESSCNRCGIKIKHCYFIVFDEKEFGPFGSECVRRML